MARQYARIEQEDLNPSEPLPWDVFNEKGFLLLKQGNTVRKEQLDRMLQSGIYAAAAALEETRQLRIGSTETERTSAYRCLADARRAIEGAFAACRAKTEDFGQRIDSLIEDVEKAIEINPLVAVAVISMKPEGPYSHRHPVDSAVIVSLLARGRDMPNTERRSLISAALTMNFGQFETQDALAKVGGLLSAAQKAEVQAHPETSAAMLEAAGVTDRLWLDTVLRHHERYDGDGYPAKLAGEAIGEHAQLLAMADWYCARLNPRADRSAQQPPTVVKLSQAEARHAFSPVLLPLLPKVLGLYPAGSMVKLANGDVAVVACHTTDPHAPIVYSVKSPRGPLHHAVRRETNDTNHEVREPVDPANLIFDKPLRLTEFWGKDAEGG
ncbi:HD-GYP domain-containing protein [Chitinimonas lacunae]|uniref:HD-GYP domain-containing protein n=1 Tax=Chitinimonas lacunae TaxID=1963018 RepID=A0ABV8MI76_9NEIS